MKIFKFGYESESNRILPIFVSFEYLIKLYIYKRKIFFSQISTKIHNPLTPILFVLVDFYSFLYLIGYEYSILMNIRIKIKVEYR